MHENFRYGLSCYNFRKFKDLESWNYSMASNCPHAYMKTWVCASVILEPSKIIGVGFHESKPITILMGKLTYDYYNIKIGIVHIAVVGAFSGWIGLPPAVTGWAASCDGGP